MSSKIEFTEVYQQDRIYKFPNMNLEIKDVISINVSKSGTHRINTKDGKKHIVPKGWCGIEFEAQDWTF